MWCQRVAYICDCNSVPWTWRLVRRDSKAASVYSSVNQITSVGNRFLLCHLKLITLPMHSPTNTRHNITSKEKFGTGTPHLADMPTAVHRQNSWKITGWSHGTVSMAMHCLGYNKRTPDGSWANHVFDAAAAVAVFDTGSEAFFFRIRHTLRPFLLKLYRWQM